MSDCNPDTSHQPTASIRIYIRESKHRADPLCMWELVDPSIQIPEALAAVRKLYRHSGGPALAVINGSRHAS
jgi:hypothetical protein